MTKIYYILIINLLLIVPSFFYFYDSAMLQWSFHLMSLCASRLFLPLLLLYYLHIKGIRWEWEFKYFIKYYSGILLYLLLSFMYFPTYLGDLQFIDKNDWFTVPAKLAVWTVCLCVIFFNLIWYKDEKD